MAVDLTQKKLNYINNYIDLTTVLLETVSKLVKARTEWDAEGYSSEIVDGDFSVQNKHLDDTTFTGGITSNQAIIDLLAANGNAHYTNLYKLPR